MSYRIRIVPEVEVWRGELRETDPRAANLFDAAVDALREGGASLGPPLVVAVPAPRQDPHPDLGPAYQQQLEKLMGMRQSVAGAATARKRVELQIDQLEEQAARLGEQSSVAGQLTELRHRHADLQAEEDRLTAVAQHMLRELETLRQEVLRQEAKQAPTENLRELRPGAPAWSGLRVLFAVEPPATAVLLAASTERDWLRAWYTEMIPRSQARYQRDQRGTG
jgi:hypothetical protein